MPQVPLSKQFTSKDKPVSAMPARKVKLSKIQVGQVDFDWGKVDSMAKKSADDFDSVPVLGKMPGGGYKALDGHHRMLAAAQRGDDSCQARIVR